MDKIFDRRFHPSEGVQACREILEFVRQAAPIDSNLVLYAEASTGLWRVLGLVSSSLAEIAEIIGDAPMSCFNTAAIADETTEAGSAKCQSRSGSVAACRGIQEEGGERKP